MTRTILIAAALIGFGLVAGRSTLQPLSIVKAQSSDGCTLGTFKGNYGYLQNGNYYDSQGYSGFYAGVGRIVADGAGTFTAVDTINVDGTVVTGRKLVGTYTVNADCTGSAVFNTASDNKIAGNWDLVFVSSGKEVNMVEKDTDIIVSGTAKLQ